MSDMTSLNGASVRDAAGRAGRVLSVTDAAIRVAWMQKGLIAEEATLERTALAEGLQVLTLKDGWQSLVGLAGVTLPKALSQTVQLAEELKRLFEAKKVPSDKKLRKTAVKFGRKRHSPFKRFHTLGPGPGKPFGTREVTKKTAWDCERSGSYKQKCTLLKKDAKGRLRKTDKKKNITIKPAYKKEYNAGYKPWHKS